MTYQLYTVPKCDDCSQTQSFLNSRGINYSVYNLRELEDKRVFGKVYLQISQNLRRNPSNNLPILPILVELNDDGKVKRVGQRLEEISKVFS